jgi:hypothetical protein
LEEWQNLAIFGVRPIGAAVEGLLTTIVFVFYSRAAVSVA